MHTQRDGSDPFFKFFKDYLHVISQKSLIAYDSYMTQLTKGLSIFLSSFVSIRLSVHAFIHLYKLMFQHMQTRYLEVNELQMQCHYYMTHLTSEFNVFN